MDEAPTRPDSLRLAWCVLLLIAPGTAAGQDTRSTDTDREVVDLGDGTYQVVRTDGVEAGDLEVAGAVTWEYQGQESFAYEPAPVDARWIEREAGYRDLSAAGLVLGSRRHDAQGGLWLAVDLELDLLSELVDEYEAKASLDAESGLGLDLAAEEVDTITGDAVLEWNEADEFWWEPNSSTTVDCGSTPDRFHIRDTDDRIRQTSLTERQKASALVFTDYGSAIGMCGGVFIDYDMVLTAAHCVYDDVAGGFVDEWNVQVCKYGNAYTDARCTILGGTAIENIFETGYYGGGWDPADDYAIIQLNTGMAGVSTMLLSSAADSWVTDFTMHNVAHPAFAPPTGTCSDNSASAVDSDGAGAFYLSHAMGDLSAPFYVSTFHFNIDGGDGHSGAPIYYCGDSWCDTGEQGVVVSVWSGWNGFYTTFVGPKVRTFRPWALAVLLL